MSLEASDEHALLLRMVQQHLDSLRRAGVDRIPAPPVIPPRTRAIHLRSAPVEVPNEPVLPPPIVAPPPAVVPPIPTATPASSLFGSSGFDTPAPPPSERPALLAELRAEVAQCTRCPHLAATRTQTVFGTGSPTARLFFVGEAPGGDEDRLGEPFVGRAGALLTDMITKGMGLTREEVYIANVLKSRPPENRTPLPDEVGHCLPFLERQIAIIRPQYLCLLGRTAASALLDTALSLARLRGRWHNYRGIPAIVTYHPSYLLRYPEEKKKAWEDLQMLMQAMGLKVPKRPKA